MNEAPVGPSKSQQNKYKFTYRRPRMAGKNVWFFIDAHDMEHATRIAKVKIRERTDGDWLLDEWGLVRDG